ncbi:M56 family metallopeptidase [Pyxidicoccus sp. MSG2]|uniref:M56 family metallopeptidase n=1 Tax=Pyxidicoccus sp. MSG2 TaxID=2996790 RepID=UPI00226F1379|nr:M56 family metallopeptidase [Pyxidicoccus sp. MSG2]MCY1019383.1 peptidase M56 [Pyxidicoccus sp. MSG2]
MDTGWLSHVGEWASAWPAGLWRASWQGALCAALVWALTRSWSKMPASLRAGLWWLVALKFVVSLGWLRPVPLPVLPASLAARVSGVEAMTSTVSPEGALPAVADAAVGGRDEAAGAVTSGSSARNDVPVVSSAPRAASPERTLAAHGSLSREGAHAKGSAFKDGAGTVALSREAARTEVPGHERATSLSSRPAGLPVISIVTDERTESPGNTASVPTTRSFITAMQSVLWSRVLAWVLLAAWAAGVAWQLRSHVRGWATMRRLRRSARPLAHPVLESEVRELSAVAKLWRVPRLLVSESVASPLATGLLDPVVVLPAKAVRRLPVEALRMALAHELAHLRRGDLWLGWVPALAEALLFFHPLARRAAREYALAREEACDAEALRLTGAEPADYGELLIAFGVARGAGTAAAMGASAHIHALHRRLSMLEHVDAVPARSRRLLKVALSALGLAALVPFQVVAQEPAAPASNDASKGAKAAVPPAPPAARVAATPPVPPAPAAPRVAGTPPVPPAPAAPRVAGTPPVPPTPRVAGIPPVLPVPAGLPVPRVGAVPSVLPLPRVAAVAPVPPPPPAPPRGRHDDDDDDDSSYVLLADNMAMMNGSSVDLNLAGMFKQPGKELLYVRRKGEAFIIRDPATLKAVRTALEPTRELGKAQGDLGEKQGALGGKQGDLGQKQGELGMKQGELGIKQAELAHKQAGLNLEEMRLERLPEAERDRRQAELRKQEQALEQEMKVLEKQQEALGEQQEALGREQEKLGEEQEALGREQEKLGEQQEAQSNEAEKKVRGLIDEALRKGLGQPLPT